jgi:hypothetical protein
MPPIAPGELTDEQRSLDDHVRRLMAGAHDVAARLYAGGPLPGALYRSAVEAFGELGTAELVFLVAQYAGISLVLNAYDVPLPPDAD